ncbi:hypothetical protein ACKWTF_006876 [Chironomus riparius]
MSSAIIFTFLSVLLLSTFVDCRTNIVRDDEQWTRPEFCTLGTDPGSCDGNFNRYYYDALVHRCKLFVYGG